MHAWVRVRDPTPAAPFAAALVARRRREQAEADLLHDSSTKGCTKRVSALKTGSLTADSLSPVPSNLPADQIYPWSTETTCNSLTVCKSAGWRLDTHNIQLRLISLPSPKISSGIIRRTSGADRFWKVCRGASERNRFLMWNSFIQSL